MRACVRVCARTNRLLCISNLEILFILGEHWLLISLKNDKNILSWFCSYGTNPRQYSHIWKRIKDTGRSVAVFPKRLQAPFVTNCSIFVVFFAYFNVRGESVKDMMKYYFKNLDLYKATIFVTCVISRLFHLPDNIETLLYDSEFALRQEING